MKKAVGIIVTVVAFLTVFLVVLSYNTLVTVSVPNSIITYKANYIEFDNAVVGGVPSSSEVVFERDSYSFVSNDYAPILYENVLEQWLDNGNAYIEGMAIKGRAYFERYRSNVYDVGSNVQYSEGVPIYIDVTISRQPVPSGYVYTVTLDGYYIEFSFEQFALNSTYTLEYQDFMSANSPSLQRPEKPDYSADNTLTAVKHFFQYIGDVFEYVFNKLHFYSNYVTFYIQDYAVLFRFD